MDEIMGAIRQYQTLIARAAAEGDVYQCDVYHSRVNDLERAAEALLEMPEVQS